MFIELDLSRHVFEGNEMQLFVSLEFLTGVWCSKHQAPGGAKPNHDRQQTCAINILNS